MKEQLKIFGLSPRGNFEIYPRVWEFSLSDPDLEALFSLSNLRSNISTDEIFPADACLFYDLEDIRRFALTGDRAGLIKEGCLQEKQPLILIAGENFGCGSAREHAAITLKEVGIGLIIAPSFNETFRNNCLFTGVLTSTDLSLLSEIMRSGEIPREKIIEELNGIEREVLEAGGLFAYNATRMKGEIVSPKIENSPRPMTIAEKIIAQHLVSLYAQQVWVKPGDQVFVPLDRRMSYEVFTPLMAKLLIDNASDQPIEDPASIVLFADHFIASQNPQVGQLLSAQQEFAQTYGILLYGNQGCQAEGIGHNLMIENHLLPGELAAGTDSHSGMWGVLGVLGMPVGVTAMANSFLTKDILIKIPQSVKINFQGELPQNCSAKDVILYLMASLPLEEMQGRILEFKIEGLDWSVDELSVLTCMAKEAGALTAIMSPNERVIQYLIEQRGLRREEIERMIVRSDPEAKYSASYTLNLEQIQPMVALPGSPTKAIPITELSERPAIAKAFIGSCVGGRWEDLVRVAKLLQGEKVAEGVKLVIQPTTMIIFKRVRESGLAEIFHKAGALFLPPNCGACIGQGLGRVEKGEIAISASTRNFPGRMGEGEVYLASPESVAASAVFGAICSRQEI